MRKISPALLLCLPLLICLGCGTTAALPEEFPRFQGTIIPIELPFNPSYRPHDVTMNMRMDLEMRAGRDRVRMPMAFSVRQSARQVGERLEWNADMFSMMLMGRSVRAKAPLMAARWRTNALGALEGFEVAFPGMKELGFPDADLAKPGHA